MKVIAFSELHAHLEFESCEVMLSYLLTQPQIQAAMPDFSRWNCKTLAEAMDPKNLLDASKLADACKRFGETAKPAFQLKPRDLTKICQKLVFANYLRTHYQSLFENFRAIEDAAKILDRFNQLQSMLPIIVGTDKDIELGADDFMTFNLAAFLSSPKQQIRQFLVTVKHLLEMTSALTSDENLNDDQQLTRGYRLTSLEILAQIVAEQFNLSSEFLANRTPELAQLPVAEVNWVEKVLNKVTHAYQAKEQTNLLTYVVELTPDRIQEYVKLQHDIAALIANEYDRPTIIVRILGKKRLANEVPDFGLLGGMGPLSDANIISNVLAGVEKPDLANMLLISSPPARKEEKERDIHAYHAHEDMRMQHLHYLRQSGASKMGMLSNAAHLHKNGFNLVTGNVSGYFGGVSFMNFVEKIAAEIRQMENFANMKIMLLGTTEAAIGNLYGSVLTNAFYPNGAKVVAEEKVPEEQVALQKYIDATKTSMKEADKVAFEFYCQLSAWIIKNEPTHILVACTELPILLDRPLSNGATVLASLKEKFGNKCPDFLSSETGMINVLSTLQDQVAVTTTFEKLLKKVDQFHKEEMAIADNNEPRKLHRRAVLQALVLALKEDNPNDGLLMIEAAQKHNSKYDSVKTLFGSKSSSSGYGNFAAQSTGLNQKGNLLRIMCIEVKQYLSQLCDKKLAMDVKPAQSSVATNCNM